jgi:opacity protein-like surface antigen
MVPVWSLFERSQMTSRICVALLTLFILISHQVPSASAADAQNNFVQLRAGGYFPSSKLFDVGTGFDLSYAIQPSPYASFEAGIGYFRADKADSSTVFISAIPITASVTAELPLQYINIYAGGGGGTYFKVVSGLAGNPNTTTELPPDRSEFSFGYHYNFGFEFPASNGLSLLVDYKHVVVNQGKFKDIGIKHGGDFVYGGFALNF